MFYRFNAHRHAATNQKKTAGKAGQRAASKVVSVLVKIKRRWAEFTDIHRGGLPKILLALMLGNLVGAAVVLVLSMILITGAEPAEILPINDKIRVPTLADQFMREEESQNLSEFGLYLDSLERAFRTDSINEIQTLKK